MAHIGTAGYLICALCKEPVEIKAASTNENEKTVHEECYVPYIRSRYKSLITIEQALSILCSDTSREGRSSRQGR